MWHNPVAHVASWFLGWGFFSETESPATFSIQESSLSDSSDSPHLISESGTGGLVCFFFDCGDFFLVGGVLDAAGVDFLGGSFRCSELFFSFFDRGLGLVDDLIPENLRRLLSPLRPLIYR